MYGKNIARKMVTSQEELSEGILDALEVSLSAERLAPYLTLANGDRRHAVRLYEWNTCLSESFWGLLQGLEVSLRNNIHRVLSVAAAKPDWYNGFFPLNQSEQNSVAQAAGRLMKDGKTVSPGRVVAELNFGFWVALTGPSYASFLWNKHLYQCFRVRLKRAPVHAHLDVIRKLRNRVAHHESILARDLMADFSRLMEVLHWICPDTAAWVKRNSTLKQRYKQRPQKTQ